MARNTPIATPPKTRSSTSTALTTPQKKARAGRSSSTTTPSRTPHQSSPHTPSSPTKAALWNEFRALAAELAGVQPPMPPLCGHSTKDPQVQYRKNNSNDGRTFTMCFVPGCKYLRKPQYLSQPLSPNVLAFLSSQRPPESSPRRSRNSWRPPATRTHYLPTDEPTSTVIARRILELRGEPAEGVDVDDYIYHGQDLSDESDDEDQDVNLPLPPAPSSSTANLRHTPSDSDDDRMWNDDFALPFWNVVAYLENGKPPVDYKLEKHAFTLLRKLFMETFSLTSHDVIAYYTSSQASWVITYVKDLKFSTIDLPDSGTLVWVRFGLTNLPDINESTDFMGAPVWPRAPE